MRITHVTLCGSCPTGFEAKHIFCNKPLTFTLTDVPWLHRPSPHHVTGVVNDEAHSAHWLSVALADGHLFSQCNSRLLDLCNESL